MKFQYALINHVISGCDKVVWNNFQLINRNGLVVWREDDLLVIQPGTVCVQAEWLIRFICIQQGEESNRR